jgi:outer membrane protein assembly factor BamB
VAIVVNCPACGTPASIDPAFYGKKLRCANQECRQLFRVSPDGKVKLEGGSTLITGASRGAEEADWLSAPPPRAGEAVPEGAGENLALGADDDEEVVTPQFDHRTGEYTYKRKKHPILVVFIFLIGLLLVGSAGLFWFYKNNQAKALEALKRDYQDAVAKKRWSEVLEKGKTLHEKVSDPGEIKDIDFMMSWATLQSDITPAKLADAASIKKSANELLQFEKTKRSEKHFGEIRRDIFESAYNLVKTGSVLLAAKPDADTVKDLEPVVQLMRVYQKESLATDDAASKEKEATTKYDAAVEAVAAEAAKKDWLVRYDEVLKKQSVSMIDDLQQAFLEQAKKHPRLQDNAELQDKLSQLSRVEPSWVLFSKKDETPPTTQFPFGTSLRICPPVKTPPEVKDDSATVLAMARGTLYGLSAQTGKDRWALRTGQDLKDLPPRISQSLSGPDLAFVVTTEKTKDEGFHSWLSCMNLTTGERVWARSLVGSCPAGPILMGTRLAVPMKEALGIVEAASGKLTGVFTFTGYDLNISPVFDKARNRLVVPVDRRRLFVLDLAQNACVGVINTGHAAGGLGGTPIIVDDTLICCITSGSGVGTTNVVGYDLKDPRFGQIANFEVVGHTTSSPFVDGETVGVVTDSGMMAFFGVGKGAPPGSKGNTPFFKLADPQPLVLSEGDKQTGVPLGRSQIAYVSLGDWWIFSQDQLIKATFDPYRGKLSVSSQNATALGTPLHRSQLSPDGKLLVTVTQAKNQPQMLATGLDSLSGQIVWQTQLGTVASGEPVSSGDTVVMLDQGGAVFLTSADQIAKTADWQVCGSWPALPVFATWRKLIAHQSARSPTATGAGEQFVVSLSFDPKRARLIVRLIDLHGKKSQSKEFPLTYAPFGTPAVAADGTVLCPCRDGNVYQFNFQSGAATSLFAWRDPNSLPNVQGHLLLASATELLATNGTSKVLRWEKTGGGAWRKAMTDLDLPARASTGLCLLPNSLVAVGDETGTLHVLSLGSLASPQQWKLSGTITKGPFRVGPTGVGCVVDGKKAWWINALGEEKGHLFTADAILGQPMSLKGEMILAVLEADERLGTLAGYAWVDLETGKRQALERLAIGLGPASGPVPLGTDRIFAPLTDGTVMILQKTKEASTAGR